MEIKFELSGRIPSKKNSKQIRRRGRYGRPYVASSDRYLSWEKTAALQIDCQKDGWMNLPVQKCESITIDAVFGDLRTKDLDNLAGSILDLMVSCKLILSDDWKTAGSLIVNPLYKKGINGALITIKTAVK